MALLLGLPILLAAVALLIPIFQVDGAGVLYLKWFVVQLDVVTAAAGAWVLLAYSLMRFVSEKLFFQKSGDKVRVQPWA